MFYHIYGVNLVVLFHLKKLTIMKRLKLTDIIIRILLLAIPALIAYSYYLFATQSFLLKP